VPKKIQENLPKTIIVGDTSALISLGVGSVLTESLSISKIIIPSMVKTEVEEMASYDDKDGMAAKAILDLNAKGKIDMIPVKNIARIEALISENTRIDMGEAEALILAEELSIPILITDDFRSIPQLKNASDRVEIHLSVYLITRLVLENVISKERALNALDTISKERTWIGAAIYKRAMKYIEEI